MLVAVYISRMATRRLNEGWAAALNRLEEQRRSDRLAVCWALVRQNDPWWSLLGVTVRGGVTVPDKDYQYAHLKLHSRMERGSVIASLLRSGRIQGGAGGREFEEISDDHGTAYWLTSGAPFGMTGPLSTPSYYFSYPIVPHERIGWGQLSEPASGPGQLYYPTAEDALADVLYGMTRHQGRRDIHNQIVIHLPYDDAYIEQVDYVNDKGVVVQIGEGGKGWASGHELQALWSIQFTETSYRRAVQLINHAGSVTFHTGAEPAYFAASLQNEAGLLVDYIERQLQPITSGEQTPLPADALHDALDFLDSVWRNVTGKNLIETHRLGPSARLAAPVTNRSDFESRLSDLADVLKAAKVDDSYIDPKLAKDLTPDKSLGRLKIALIKVLSIPEAEVATQAVEVLQNILRVRAALQHVEARPDLPTALASLGITSTADWAQTWQVVRHRAVDALRDLRQALETGLI
jgi:hypothetical protein